MDKVRFGRALGYGARHAAKAAKNAVDAAMEPDPIARSRPATSAPPAQPMTPRVTAARVAQAGKHARRSFWAPLTAFSSVISLQVAGTFFTIFAIFMGEGVWRQRAALHGSLNTPEAHRLYLALAMFLAFSYFALSSFVRAALRERR